MERTVLLMIERQKKYLLQCQLPSGTFRMSPHSPSINPYFTNLALLALVSCGELSAVKNHLDWYLAHVSADGFVNDYRLEDGKEIDTGKADSEDSYHATYFTLLAAYLTESGDIPWCIRNRDVLRTLLSALLSLQQPDGLTWAKRRWKVKYLMDNCEAYKGLADAAFLFGEIGEKEAARLAHEGALACRRGIAATYDPKRKTFAVYDRYYPRWTKWYPDATSQAFPVLYGIIPPQSGEAIQLYDQLTASFPCFDTFRTGDLYPWMIMGEFARLMGDEERVRRMVNTAADLYIFGPRAKYWLIHEAARFLRLLD
ncbi:hypothetical protein G3578_14280 [Brevibacillus sp. SYP-B805]|uniref:hypothetical protein n=1 Tax=Brevibacillus sp. SYP-B805 TaxID=1578199 RepID=UPI0013EDF37A|nr:hypothetical protein [Brevibacillus sp. SYP-B805]NGQ96329.1 hypothetical protein [Brevibacillus sp. SYP-B805]